MRFLKLFCVVLVLCVSCSENTDEIEVVGEVKSSKIERRVISSKEIQEVKLMYMTSFLIGKVLIENKEARDYFYEQIANPKIKKIALINVLGTNKSDSNPFTVSFQEQYNMYNFRTPASPIKSSEPDPLIWGGVLNMYYKEYLLKVRKRKKWELYFPNKNIFLDNIQNLSEYLIANEKLICLWNTNYLGLFTDGLILNINGRGRYLPQYFDPSNTTSLMIVLRDKAKRF
jgi:hypothetical protein